MCNDFKKILVLVPHTDDAELGCGATIAKIIEKGREVFMMVFSMALPVLGNSHSAGEVKREAQNAASILGLKKENLFFFNYQARTFNESRQNILDDMVKIRNSVIPELVFLPSLDDFHQDHAVISREGLRAFKHASILGYEEPWNALESKVNFFIRIEENHLQKKIMALGQYKSQTGRKFFEEKRIKSLATVRGLQANTDYAEAFETVRFYC